MMASASLTTVDEGHERARKRVCIVCYRKGTRSLSERDIENIRTFAIFDYKKGNPDLPCGLCSGCYLLLSKLKNGAEVQLPIADDYDPIRPMNMRSMNNCNCRICIISSSKNQDALSLKRKPGRPSLTSGPSTNKQKQEVFKVCSNCFTKIYRGCDHSASMCASRRQKVYNIEKLVADDDITKERLASRTINATDSSLATLGSKQKPIHSKPKEGHTLSIEGMSAIQTDLNLSVRQVHRLCKDLRQVSSSRTLIQAGLKSGIYDTNHKLDDQFELRLLQYTDNRNVSFERWTVVCRDLSAFVDNVITERNIDTSEMILKIGIDGGGGFLKVTLSVFDLNESVNTTKTKDSGVKKCFLIGIVPCVPENYVNVKRLWLNIAIDGFQREFTIAADLKLCNILLGLMAHGSLHPCCWCNIHRKNLASRGELRTLSTLRELFWTYFDSGASKCNAKQYGNVIHPPIVHSADEYSPVLDLIPPPELHLLSGPVNTLFNGMKELFPNESNEWLAACHVQQDPLHGGSFTGNASRTLLRNVDKLREISPAECASFVDTFQEFNSVVQGCYGHELADDYKDRIKKFRDCYMKTKMSVTPKVHAVFHHITDFCSFKRRGLGAWSEQTVEATHHEFEMTWKHYKMNDISNPNYGKQLLAAVCMFNSKHM